MAEKRRIGQKKCVDMVCGAALGRLASIVPSLLPNMVAVVTARRQHLLQRALQGVLMRERGGVWSVRELQARIVYQFTHND